MVMLELEEAPYIHLAPPIMKSHGQTTWDSEGGRDSAITTPLFEVVIGAGGLQDHDVGPARQGGCRVSG